MQIVRSLLTWGADVNQKTVRGSECETVRLRSERPRRDTSQLARRVHRASPACFVQSTGNTALCIAHWRGHEEVKKLLLESGRVVCTNFAPSRQYNVVPDKQQREENGAKVRHAFRSFEPQLEGDVLLHFKVRSFPYPIPSTSSPPSPHPLSPHSPLSSLSPMDACGRDAGGLAVLQRWNLSFVMCTHCQC